MPNDSDTKQQLPKEFQEFVEKIAKLQTPDLGEKYSDAVNYLDEEFAYFLTHVLNIGEPQWNGLVPTAAVALPKPAQGKAKEKDFIFVFNPEFVKLMQLEEIRGDKVNEREAMAFILAHETMHVLLNHLKLFKSNRFPDKGRLNIAADCVINDYLEGMGLIGIPGLARGEEQVGYNAANATVSEVYADLPEKPACPQCGGKGEVGDDEGDDSPGEGESQSGDQEGDQNGDGGQNGDGPQGKQPCPTCQGSGENPGGYGGVVSIDDHEWIYDADADQQQAAEQAGSQNPADIDRTKQDDDYQSSLNPGVGVGGAQAFTELHGVSLKWADLLKRINPFVFKRGPKPRADWSRRPRKLTSISPNKVNLPTRKSGIEDSPNGAKPAIVMALDTSGSIGQKQANQFVNMARSIPQDKIKLFVCTFTTSYQELDLDNPEWNSGGTDFDPITEYIENEVMPNNRKRYPTAVVVVTDGYATFRGKQPDEKQSKNWTWLLTSDGIENYGGSVLPGTIDHLNKYQKGNG